MKKLNKNKLPIDMLHGIKNSISQSTIIEISFIITNIFQLKWINNKMPFVSS
jgi:hypothetical protein